MATGDTSVLSPGVLASNALTARWVEAAGGRRGQLVVSGAAVWPLLAALAAGAEGRAREELERAVGMPADGALAAMGDVLGVIDRGAGTHGAIGLWVREDVPLRTGWSTALPAGIRGVLSRTPERDQAALDAWVRERTLGILNRLPVQVESTTLLLLAACLAIRTTWATPFESSGLPRSFLSGPWKHRLVADLHASFEDLARVTVFDTPLGPLTTFNSRGADAVDVHLVLGAENVAAGEVLREGIVAVMGRGPRRSGGELRPGDIAPGLVVEEIRCQTPEPPYLSVETVGFEVTAEHDLLGHGDLFGLTTASDARRGHFPGISDWPLAVERALQRARATFTATGFDAAAVTSIGFLLGATQSPPPRYTVRVIQLAFDRPFGFIAIDRSSGLVLVAGWVDEPAPHPDAADYEVIREGDPGAWGVPLGGGIIQHRDLRPDRKPDR